MAPSINHMPIYNCSEFTNKYQNHDYNNGQKKKDKRTNNDLQKIHIKLKIE